MNYGLGIFKRLARCSVLFLLLPRITWSGDSDGRMESVSVSPDGKLLAVDFVKGNASFIYKIPVDSGVAMRLTDAKDGEESSPAFSSGGKQIGYAYSPGDHRRSRIVIVNVDGSDPRQWSPSGVSDFSPVCRRTARPLFSPGRDPTAARHPLHSPIPTRGTSMRVIWTAQVCVSLPTRIFTWPPPPRCLLMGGACWW